MVDKNDKKGREAFMRGLNLIRKEQTDLLGAMNLENYVTAGPNLSMKRKTICKCKATSPQKKR